MEKNNDKTALRFGGIARLYGQNGLSRLKNSHILVVGLGGVGSWVVEALTRSGIGHLTIVDLDEVCITNTNRQLCATSETIGKSKAQTLKNRAQLVNPEINITTIENFFTEKSYEEILKTKYDYVLDCIDSLDNKCLLISESIKRNYPILTMGGAAGKIDPSEVKMTDLAFSINDSLLQRVRKKLRRDYGFKRNPGQTLKSRKKMGVHCVYSPEDQRFPTSDGQISCNLPSSNTNLKMDCESGLGSSLMVTGTFAYLGSAFVVNELTKN
jgi:tRNA A37 threonylcarbamoyladenosine dehydratase